MLQLQELEVEFEKVKDEKAVIQRYLRSQQVKQSKMAEAAIDDGNFRILSVFVHFRRV